MYCIHCGKNNKDSETGLCKYCGEQLIYSELTHEDIRELSKSLHNRFNKSRETFNAGMVGVVLGSTFLIIGIIFFVLSFKVSKDPDVIGKVLTVSCFEFWVSMAASVAGLVLLIAGLIKVIITKLVVQPEINKTLAKITSGNYSHLAD